MKQISFLFFLAFILLDSHKDIDPVNSGNTLVLAGKFPTVKTVQIKPMVM